MGLTFLETATDEPLLESAISLSSVCNLAAAIFCRSSAFAILRACLASLPLLRKHV